MEILNHKDIDVGALVGHHEALGLIAGRCSAAQAHALRDLREQKLYRRCGVNWPEFCVTYLKMSKTRADLAIRLLDEFGQGFFELSQFTRVSPQTYRLLAPAVKDGALHCEGRVIPLTEEN